DLQRIHQAGDRAGEVRRVVRGGDRLVRLAETREVERDDAVAVGQRGDRRQERRLGPAQAVDADHRLTGAGTKDGDARLLGTYGVEAKARRIGHAARGREEPHTQVEVPAHLKPAFAEGLHAAPYVVRDLHPRLGVRAEEAVGADPALRGLELGRPLAEDDVPRV